MYLTLTFAPQLCEYLHIDNDTRDILMVTFYFLLFRNDPLMLQMSSAVANRSEGFPVLATIESNSN